MVCTLESGQVLGGEPLPPAIRQRIRESDSLIAVFTKDTKIEGKELWNPTDWVRDELGVAREANKSCIALIETNVQPPKGLYSDFEYINFDRSDLTLPMLRLSETIFLWKSNEGRSVGVRIRPKEAAELACSMGKCFFRIGKEGQPLGAPQPTWVDDYGDDLFVVRIGGVQEEHEIQIEIREGESTKWRSQRVRQLVHVELRPVKP